MSLAEPLVPAFAFLGGAAEAVALIVVTLALTFVTLVFGELYRNGADWKFRAVGQGYASGLAGIARDFGVNV